VVTHPSTGLHLRCVLCVYVQYIVPLCQVFVIAARLGNWLLLLHLVIAADITGHGNFLQCHTDTFNVPLYRRRAVFYSSNPLYKNCYQFYRPRKDGRLGWPCLYRELNHGSPAWTRMNEHTQEPTELPRHSISRHILMSCANCCWLLLYQH
jgi:hypothetical protein